MLAKKLQSESKEQKVEFLGMLLGTLGASLLGNMLAVKGRIATRWGRALNREGYDNKEDGITRAGYGNNIDF